MSAKSRLTFKDVEIYPVPKALEESIDFSKFKWGKQYFADYLRGMAPQDDKNNVAKVWVFVTHEREVIGYVTLIMSQLSKSAHLELKAYVSSIRASDSNKRNGRTYRVCRPRTRKAND